MSLGSVVTLSYSADRRYVICHETRLLTHAELPVLFQDLLRMALRTGPTPVLIDCRAQHNAFSLADAYFYGMAFVEAALFRFKFALLVEQRLPCRDFLETVAKNSGIRLQYFTDLDQAHAWLLA